MAGRQGNDFRREKCSWTSLLLPGKEAASLHVACHSSSCHPRPRGFTQEGAWGTPVTFASGAVCRCPQGWFLTAQATVGCGGGGEGLGVFIPAGLGVGSVWRVPWKASAFRCGSVLQPRDTSPLTGAAAQLLPALGVLTLHPKPTEELFLGGIPIVLDLLMLRVVKSCFRRFLVTFVGCRAPPRPASRHLLPKCWGSLVPF